MSLNNKDLEIFKAIYKDKFGKELSNNEAFIYATALLNFTKTLLLNKNKVC